MINTNTGLQWPAIQLGLCLGIPADVDFKSAHFPSNQRFFKPNCCVSKTVCIWTLLASSVQPQWWQKRENKQKKNSECTAHFLVGKSLQSLHN